MIWWKLSWECFHINILSYIQNQANFTPYLQNSYSVFSFLFPASQGKNLGLLGETEVSLEPAAKLGFSSKQSA